MAAGCPGDGRGGTHRRGRIHRRRATRGAETALTRAYDIAAVDSERAALTAAVAIAEDALALHHEALILIAEGWRSESGSAATDLLHQQYAEAAALVAALHDTAGELRSLQDSLEAPGSPRIDAAAYDRVYAGLTERPTPRFATPASAAPPSQPPVPPESQLSAQSQAQQLPTVTPGGFSPLNVGAALAGLAFQIAGLASQADSYAAGGASGVTDNTDPDPVEPARSERKPSPRRDRDAARHTAPAVPRGTPVALQKPPPARPETPAVAAPPEPPVGPLLAAERPLEPQADTSPGPAAAESQPALQAPGVAPAPDPRTPCEIAADELPQVGQ